MADTVAKVRADFTAYKTANDARVAKAEAALAALRPAPVPPAPAPPAPPVVTPPAPSPPAPAGSKALVSALPAGVGKLLFDEPFTDQARMAWHPRFNPNAPWKRSYYFNTQIDAAGWEDAGSRQGENDLQLYTDLYYPSQYDPSGSGVTNAPGTLLGVETVKIVNNRARISVLANTDTTNNPQLRQWFGGHPTPSGQPVKRCGALLTTEKSFSAEYGYFVTRLNTDGLTPGSWPGLWMLPTPATMGLSAEWKELDALEKMGNQPRRAFITYHGGDGLSIYPDIWTPGFHDVGILITPTTISTYLDGVLVPGSTKANKYPKGIRWYYLIDLAVGGWDGQKDMEAPALPAFMDADYFKAFALA